MATTFTTTLPDGSIAKRASKTRTYTHVIALGPRPKGEQLKAANAMLAHLTRYGANLVGQLTRTEDALKGGLKYSVRDIERFSRGRSYGRIVFNGYNQFSHYTEKDTKPDGTLSLELFYKRITKEHARTVLDIEGARAKVAEIEASPNGLNEWVAESWCGRPELVADRVATFANYHPLREVRAFEVTASS